MRRMRIRPDLEPRLATFLTLGELSNVITARFVRGRLFDLLAKLPLERLRYSSDLDKTVVHRSLEERWSEAVVMALLDLDRAAAVPAKRQQQLRTIGVGYSVRRLGDLI